MSNTPSKNLMSNTPSNSPRPTPLSDEEIIIDQEIHHSDGSVRRRRETLRRDDPSVEERLERNRLEMDRQLKIRDNDNAARGLLMGVIVTTFLGMGILAWYFFTNRQDTEVAPVVIPAQPSEPSTPPDINITLPNPPAAPESATETAPTQPAPLQTQPAPSQPVPSSPTAETAPVTNPELASPESTYPSTPNEPTGVVPPDPQEPASAAPAESSTGVTP